MSFFCKGVIDGICECLLLVMDHRSRTMSRLCVNDTRWLEVLFFFFGCPVLVG